MKHRPRRSVLYMPGSNARALEKAKTLPADALILDLEDAVAPEMKTEARNLVAQAVMRGGYGPRELVIRTNAADTAHFQEDFRAAVDAAPDAILVPKIQAVDDLLEIAGCLEKYNAPPKTRIWAMMETPLAMLRAEAIAQMKHGNAATRLDVIVMGTNDLAKETRVRQVPGRGPMLGWFSSCVAAARAHGLDVLDGVYNDISDSEGFRRECEQGRDFGMDGKTLIHPSQISICNEVFSPTAAEVDWSQKVIAAFQDPQNRAASVVQIDGKMVERLHAEMARRLVSVATAVTERENC